MTQNSTNISRRLAMTLSCLAIALLTYRTDLTLAITILVASPLPLLMLLFPASKPADEATGRPTDGWFETHEWYEPSAAEKAKQGCHDGRQGCCGPTMSHQDFTDFFERRRETAPALTLDEARTILGITEGASAFQARAAYRDAAKRTHPDQGGNHEDFLKVQTAWDCAKGAHL